MTTNAYGRILYSVDGRRKETGNTLKFVIVECDGSYVTEAEDILDAIEQHEHNGYSHIWSVSVIHEEEE